MAIDSLAVSGMRLTKLLSAKYPSFFFVLETGKYVCVCIDSNFSYASFTCCFFLVIEKTALVRLCLNLNCHDSGNLKLTSTLAARCCRCWAVLHP